MSSEDHSSTKEFKSFILLRLTSPWRAEAALAIKEGDEACAKVISILEESASYLEEDTHNQLQRRYDQLNSVRLQFRKGSGFFVQVKQWNKIARYRTYAIDLHGDTVISTQVGRSRKLWLEKGGSSLEQLGRDENAGLAYVVPVDGVSESDDSSIYSEVELRAMQISGDISMSDNDGPFADPASDLDAAECRAPP